MRSYTILVVAISLLFAACRKTSIGTTGNSQNTPVLQNVAPVTQVPGVSVAPQTVPHTDTFYGKLYIGAWVSDHGDSTDLQAYVSYTADKQITFSSAYYFSRFFSGSVRLYGSYAVNDSGHYSYVLKKGVSYTDYQLRKDSMYYDGASESCPDQYYFHFAGRKTNGTLVAVRH